MNWSTARIPSYASFWSKPLRACWDSASKSAAGRFTRVTPPVDADRDPRGPVTKFGIEMSLVRLRKIIWLALLLALSCERQAAAYSLLTHEQLIDLTWKESI